MKLNCLFCLLASLLGAVAILLLQSSTTVSAAETEKKPQPVELADGQLLLAAPGEWERKRPGNRIIEHEFAAPAVEGDQQAGRLTIMGAGGSVDANIQRWIGQFTQKDGSSSADAAKTEKKKIAGMEVHLVDISGTYLDQPGGPFAGGKKIERPDYRMLAAIIVSGDQNIGNYFLKFYGPEKTIKANADAFHKMVETLKKK